ncbi:MAG TPA: TetR/AcrR family transcriptional regulator [Nevskiaceae bacterium]|nr:TetR/AcrR family transcriptional regulator [Nevskiaceae bacterium]
MKKAESYRRLASEQMLLPADGTPARGSRSGILSAALKLFAERGYGGTSVRDIAAVSQVQPATLYAHFPSKQHVLSELIALGHEEHLKRMRAALLETSADPAEQIAALVRAHVEFHTTYPMLSVVANSELHSLEGGFAAPALALRKQAEQMLSEVIRRGIEKGEFDVPHEWLAMAWIGGAGLRVGNWYTEDFELPPEAVAEHYVELAWRVLGVTRKRTGRKK